jgi:acetyltransferase-like isoleucine patch superfamily enzyme
MNLIIYGAGGHAKVVGEAAYSLAEYERIIFVDPSVDTFSFIEDNPKFSLVSSYSIQGKESETKSFCAIGGNVLLGDKVFVGGNAFINPNLSICSDVTIGSGSVVTTDINKPGTYVGSPVIKIV